MQTYPDLSAALAHEQTAMHDFVALLQQEQRLLTENSLELLPPLAERKATHALQLNQLTETRRQLQQKYSGSLEVEIIKSWYQTNCPAALTVWLEIRDMADEAHHLNHVNGELIQMKLRHNQQALAALNQAVNNANLYGPDGQTNFTPGSGRSLGSV